MTTRYIDSHIMLYTANKPYTCIYIAIFHSTTSRRHGYVPLWIFNQKFARALRTGKINIKICKKMYLSCVAGVDGKNHPSGFVQQALSPPMLHTALGVGFSINTSNTCNILIFQQPKLMRKLLSIMQDNHNLDQC